MDPSVSFRCKFPPNGVPFHIVSLHCFPSPLGNATLAGAAGGCATERGLAGLTEMMGKERRAPAKLRQQTKSIESGKEWHQDGSRTSQAFDYERPECTSICNAAGTQRQDVRPHLGRSRRQAMPSGGIFRLGQHSDRAMGPLKGSGKRNGGLFAKKEASTVNIRELPT